MRGIREIFSTAFPDYPVGSISQPEEGNRKQTAIVGSDDSNRIVIQRSNDPAASAIEARTAREIASRTAVPVPAVIESGAIGATGYQITEYIDGDNLHEHFTSLGGENRARIVRQFGRALGSLHAAFEFDHFGSVTVNDERLKATEEESYRPWFRRYSVAGIEALPPAFADLKKQLRAAINSASLPDTPIPRLFPWDFRPGNAVIIDDRLAAFLDWGEPLAAGAGLSVAKTEYLLADWYLEDEDTLRATFRDGYTSVRPLPTITRGERLTAVIRSAVDSDGAVTRPGYPEREGSDAVAFHRKHLTALL